MLVKDVMNAAPLTTDADSTLESAVQTMVQEKSSCLVVLHAGKPCGIMTERDVTLAFAQGCDGTAGEPRLVKECMTADPVVVPSTLPYTEALALSRSRRLRHLPVVDEQGQLLGIVTQTSLIDALSSMLNEQIRLESNIEELKMLSLEDPLMKVGNRRAMEVDLNYTQAEAQRLGKQYSIALFDIDFFKRYNDTYGHQAGDEALKRVAAIIKDSVRKYDRVFRYGGEELLVLMPETTERTAAQCAERIRANIHAAELKNEDTPLKLLTVSGGVCTAMRGEWEAMLSAADAALYNAKENGRNQIKSRTLVPQ